LTVQADQKVLAFFRARAILLGFCYYWTYDFWVGESFLIDDAVEMGDVSVRSAPRTVVGSSK
jgi:hypothetical protein